MEDADLRALALRSATGDLGAAEELMCGVHDRLFALLHLMGIPKSDMEDVAQDVALQMYRSLENYDASKPFMPWLRSIVLHVRANFWRSEKRRDKRLETFRTYLTEQIAESDEADDLLDTRRSHLRHCMGKLQERLRGIVTLHYHEGLASGDIGKRLNLKAQTVRKLLSRARMFLRDCISRQQAETV